MQLVNKCKTFLSRFFTLQCDFWLFFPGHIKTSKVAFLGRSNSGKSSLINSLTRRKDLARISKTPGRTQQVNYFALLERAKISDSINISNNNNRKKNSDSSSLSFRPSDAIGFFVDLPGYGYAYAPDAKVDEWQTRTIEFLMHRQELGVMTRVHLLIDSRHGIMDMDRAVMGWLDAANISYTLVFTKSDLANSSLLRSINESCMRFHSQMYGSLGGSQGPIVHVTSSKTNMGIPELLWSIDGDFTNYVIHENDDFLENLEDRPTVL